MTATPASRVRAPRPSGPRTRVSHRRDPCGRTPRTDFARTHSARTDFARTEEPRP
ncbi:hypothetical protein ROS62_11390 [Streptomyces sp. DSM 41972]|uniref:Uncharacterized protein n=1 Tax=Streptomyces althioticus subsp. attaecolombicae TaxID=3075534 RepID=A0ABU3HXN0_9ACTN|nr:hypothetical protein [Streptomyces sp. DSM 41972]